MISLVIWRSDRLQEVTWHLTVISLVILRYDWLQEVTWHITVIALVIWRFNWLQVTWHITVIPLVIWGSDWLQQVKWHVRKGILIHFMQNLWRTPPTLPQNNHGLLHQQYYFQQYFIYLCWVDYIENDKYYTAIFIHCYATNPKCDLIVVLYLVLCVYRMAYRVYQIYTLLCYHIYNSPVNVNPVVPHPPPQADKRNSDAENVCLSESTPCHELSRPQIFYISIICNIRLMLERITVVRVPYMV